MAIPLSDYEKIFSRPGRKRIGDEGFELSAEDEKALDEAWAEVAEEDGVIPLAPQLTEAEIRESLS